MLPEIAAALGEREPQRVENQLCEMVAALHPDLHFSLERGIRSIYAFVVSGQESERLAGERLRRVEAADTEPADSIGLLELRELVHRLAR